MRVAAQTVDNPSPMRPSLDTHGGIVKGMPPFTFNPCQNGNFFGSFHFGDSSCRHFVDSLSSHPLRVAASLWMAVTGFEPEFVGAAALGRPRTRMKAGETGRRGRRPRRDGAE